MNSRDELTENAETSVPSPVDKAVHHGIHDCRDFYHLIKELPGIHPIDIKHSLVKLRQLRLISDSKYRKLVGSACELGMVAPDHEINIPPVPHIVHFDWRFSGESIDYLIALIKSYTNKLVKNKPTVVFIGCPSVFMSFIREYDPETIKILIDINSTNEINVENNWRTIKYDIRTHPSNFKLNIYADVIIMDPPWHIEYYQLFFNFAYSLCSEATYVFCAIAPSKTKLNASAEYYKLREYLTSLCFTSVCLKRGVLRYNTPPFERNALRANGILCLPANWRTGDLIISFKPNVFRHIQPIYIQEFEWDEFSIGLVRFLMHKQKSEYPLSFDIDITSPFANDIMPSIRRKYPLRSSINILTSGNRGYHCTNLPLFQLVLTAYENNFLFDFIFQYTTPVQEESILIVAEKINEIVTLENKEYQIAKWATKTIR